jgi:hypothetical protein
MNIWGGGGGLLSLFFMFIFHFGLYRLSHGVWFYMIYIHSFICWMVCFIQFVSLPFSYWLWRRVIRYTYFRLRAHGRCDRSAEDAYSSAAPYPTFAFFGGPCCPTLDFVIAFWIMIAIYTLLTSLLVVCFLFPNLGKGVENTQRVGNSFYHMYHPLPAFRLLRCLDYKR